MEFNLDDFLNDLNPEIDFQEAFEGDSTDIIDEERFDLSQNDMMYILDHINIFNSSEEYKKIENLHQRTLNSLYSLKGISYLSLHKVTDDFDIILRSIKPLEKQEDAEQLFKSLLDMGRVGKMLNTGNYIEISKQHELGFVCSAFPLLYGDSCWGILLVVFEDNIITHNYTKAISLFAGLLGPNLRIIELQDQNEKILADQVQIISEKTNEIRNSRRQLNAIIDTVQAGIILADKKTKKIISINHFAEGFTGHHLSDIIEKDVTLDTLFDDYTVSFAAKKDRVKTIGGRYIEVMRNTEVTKLSDKDIIVETFLDISFVKELRQEYEIEKRTLESKYQLQINKLKDANLELSASINTAKSPNLLNSTENGNFDFSEIFQQLQYDIRQPLSNIVLMTENLLALTNDSEKSESFNKSITRSYELILSNLDDMSYSHQKTNVDAIFFDDTIQQIAQLNHPDLIINIKNDIKDNVLINTYVFRKSTTNIVSYFKRAKINETEFEIASDLKNDILLISFKYISDKNIEIDNIDYMKKIEDKKVFKEKSHLWSASNSLRILGGNLRLIGFKDAGTNKKIELELPFTKAEK